MCLRRRCSIEGQVASGYVSARVDECLLALPKERLNVTLEMAGDWWRLVGMAGDIRGDWRIWVEKGG